MGQHEGGAVAGRRPVTAEEYMQEQGWSKGPLGLWFNEDDEMQDYDVDIEEEAGRYGWEFSWPGQ